MFAGHYDDEAPAKPPLSFTKCPLCGMHSYALDEPLPGRSRQGAKYDFSLMAVGDSVVLPMTQPQVWSRVQSWRNAKTHRERHSWEFATRKLNETETRLWRTK